MGTPERAQAFRSALHLPFTVLADPEHRAYYAFGLRQTSAMNEASLPAVTSLVAHGLRYGGMISPVHHMTQLGGTFIIDRSGTIRFSYRSERSSDYPSIAMILQAAEAIQTP